MPVDHSIYFQQKPVDLAGAAEQGMRMGDLMRQRKAAEAADARARTVDKAISSNVVTNPDGTVSFNHRGAMLALAKGNLGKESMEMQEKAMAHEAAKAQQESAQLESNLKKANAFNQIIGSAKDQQSYSTARAEAIRLGLAGEGMLPEQFDPNYVAGIQQRGLTIQERFQREWQEKEAQRAQKNADRSHGLQREQFAFQKETDARDFGAKRTDADRNYDLSKRETQTKEAVAQAKAAKAAAPKPMNLSQAKQLGNFELGALAEKQYQEATTPEGNNPISRWWNQYDPSSSFQWIDKNDWAPNVFKSEKSQKANSAADRWVEVFLRDASGAAIPPSERGAYIKDYFPVAGDSAQVIKDKAAARQQKMRNAQLAAGAAPDAPEGGGQVVILKGDEIEW